MLTCANAAAMAGPPPSSSSARRSNSTAPLSSVTVCSTACRGSSIAAMPAKVSAGFSSGSSRNPH